MNKKFDEIYKLAIDFFCKIIELYRTNIYDYLILTTRRCFCLFFALLNDKVFDQLLKNHLPNDDYEILNEIVKKTISSQNVEISGDKLIQKKILLLDDVMIHGHALYNLYKKVEEKEPEKLDTLVLIRNIEWPDFYLFKTNKSYDSIKKLTSSEWRKISNQIIKYIHYQGQSYTSYIYGIETENKIIEDVILKKDQIHEIKIDLKNLETYPEYEDDNYPRYYSVKDFNYTFIDSIIIRRYETPTKQNKSIIVPYVQLKNMSVETLEKIWNTICEQNINDSALCDIVSIKERYKVLSAICGVYLYKYLFGEITNFNNIIDKSFKPNFLKTITGLGLDNIFSIIDSCFDEVEPKYNKVLMEDYFQIAEDKYFGDSETEKNKISDFLNIYFYLVTEKEDSIYQSDPETQNCVNPIFYSRFYSLLKKNENISVDDIYTNAILIYLSDIGLISYVIEENFNYVGTAIKTGEQSYHLFKKIAGDAYKAVYVLLNYINKIDTVSNRKVFIDIISKNLEKEPSLTQDAKARIRFFINNPPTKIRESYFGILEECNKCNDAIQIETTNRILKSIIKVMEVSCKGLLIL